MKIITKKRLFIRKYYDFLIVDLIAFILGFYVSLIFRRSIDISLYNQNRLLTYGIVAVVSFLAVELFSENLKGIAARGLVREVEVVTFQMTITWTLYLSILFFMHNIYALSRIFAAVNFLICWIFLLVFRNAWKMFCMFSKKSSRVMPGLLIVTEASRAQAVLDRLVPGALSKEYEICAVIMNEKGEPDYRDWYPHDTGLENIEKYTGERRVRYAYVELDDRDEEKSVIDRFLEAGVVVYRSLGNSVLEYADQAIGQLDGKSVIVISGAESSLASKIDKAWQQLRQKLSKAGEPKE